MVTFDPHMPRPRPAVFDFTSTNAYVAAMLDWRKTNERGFSIRALTANLPGCSRTLISKVIKGTRRLNRNHLPAIARLLDLSYAEKIQLDRWIDLERRPLILAEQNPSRNSTNSRRPQNHLLDHWLHLYVKDACKLRGFQPDPVSIHRLLGGIASVKQIETSLNFLLREGFLRRTLQGHLVLNEPVTVTTDGPPHQKIKAFHKKALSLARRNMDLQPSQERRESAMVMHLNQENMEKLKDLLKGFHDALINFADEHPNDDEKLYQVLINLTKVGGP